MTTSASPAAEDSTSRLELYRPRLADVPGVFEICTDPRVWTHYPTLRHISPERTADVVRTWITGWEDHGLDTWVVREREGGLIVGYGGCSLLQGDVWNLGYRLAVAVQGQGFATELSRTAIERAEAAKPELPIIAYLLEHNHASAAVAKKLGMTLVHRGSDTGNPDPAAVRLIYADRPLTEQQLGAARR